MNLKIEINDHEYHFMPFLSIRIATPGTKLIQSFLDQSWPQKEKLLTETLLEEMEPVHFYNLRVIVQYNSVNSDLDGRIQRCSVPGGCVGISGYVYTDSTFCDFCLSRFPLLLETNQLSIEDF